MFFKIIPTKVYLTQEQLEKQSCHELLKIGSPLKTLKNSKSLDLNVIYYLLSNVTPVLFKKGPCIQYIFLIKTF